MKKIITLLFIGISSISFAQSALTVFSNQGERFYLILNGIRQNEKPETNIRVEGLKAPYYQAKVIFENSNMPDIDKNIPVNDPETGQNADVTYSITKNKKGETVLRYYSATPVGKTVVTAPSTTVIQYNTIAMPPIGTHVSVTQTTQEQHTTQQTNDHIDVNVNVPGINMNVNIDDPLTNSSTHSTTTTTTTTTTTYTTSPNYDDRQYLETMPKVDQEIQQEYHMDGYRGKVGCPGWPMSDAKFQEAYNSIKSQSFADTQLGVAKQITKGNCLTSKQVKSIMQLFAFEDNKLQFAKYAYDHTFDIENYYIVNEAFNFSSSVDELNKYLGF